MMTFEEFFKKKKISLHLLQAGEPTLFAEFKNHYEQMGEKSFDHTKKYLFNPLRHKYPAPIEVKVEKVHIENQIAEQTINEALSEVSVPVPSTGFKPRFKAAITAKPPEEKPIQNDAATEEKFTEPSKASPAGFKPRFKAAMVAKPVEEKPAEPEMKGEVPIEVSPAEETPKPVGFKPRFNAAKMTKAVTEELPVEPEDKKEEAIETPSAEEAPKPVGFKPRFNAARMKPKE